MSLVKKLVTRKVVTKMMSILAAITGVYCVYLSLSELEDLVRIAGHPPYQATPAVMESQ